MPTLSRYQTDIEELKRRGRALQIITSSSGDGGGGSSGGLTTDDLTVRAKRDKGAYLDGGSHPLSTVYGTLAAAQVVYPHATALTDEIDWCAIQGCIDDALGSADPTTTTRTATREVVVEPGTAILNKTLVIRSAFGLRFIAAGPFATQFLFTATLASGLDLDGVAACHFEGFAMSTDSSSHVVDKMMFAHWGDTTARSTTSNTVTEVWLAGWYRAGFSMGSVVEHSPTTAQVDNFAFYACAALGAWSTGNTTTWQMGWELGNGQASNALDYYLYGCTWSFTRYGVFADNTNFFIYGGQVGGCEVDVNMDGTTISNHLVDGLRSEQSGRLFYAAGGANYCQITIRDSFYSADSLTADGWWIVASGSIGLILDNVMCYPNAPGGVTPAVYLGAPSASYLHSCRARNVSSQTVAASAFVQNLDAQVDLKCDPYLQISAADGSVTAITVI